MQRSFMALILAILTLSAAAEQRWVDDFRNVHHLHAIDGAVQRRAFGRIVTHPDVRLNSSDPSVYIASDGGQALGYGWFPTIHRLHNGTLICAHREGVEHGMAKKEARAVVEHSTDGGRTWTGPTVVLQRPGWGISPMQIFQLRDGSVWMNLRMLELGKGWKSAIMRSTDNGHTWQQISDKGGYIACEMSNGELLWLTGAPGPEEPGQRWPWSSSRATRTSRWVDGKIVWSDDRVHHELGPTSDEWMVAETDVAGELVALMRQQQHSHYFVTAKSKDYGRTWTKWRSSNLYIGPIPCRPSIRSMGDGRLIATFGQRWIGRTFAAVSYDRGETWDVANRQVILHSPRQFHAIWDSHYTDIARAEGGLWLAVDYIASPRDPAKQRGIYGTFIDERFFKKAFAGLQLAYTLPAFFPKSVGLWRFDELDGPFARDDINANFGEINGAKRVPGHLATALQFNGKDDHVLIWDDASLHVPRFFGVSAWINTPDPGKEQTIVSKAPAYTLLLKDGVPQLEIGNSISRADVKPLKPDTWYHIAATHSMRYNYTRVTHYLNGREMSNMRPVGANGNPHVAKTFAESIAQTDQRLSREDPRMQEFGHRKITHNECLVIGMDNDLKSRPFTGMIDEVLLHSGPFKSSLGKAAGERRFVQRAAVASEPIQRSADGKWTTFNAKTTLPERTSIQFTIDDADGKTLVKNVSPGADISHIAAPVIVLRAQLTSDLAGQTPILHQWSVGAHPAMPGPWRRPVPDQTAALIGKKGKAPLMTRINGVSENALRIAPQKIDASLYRVPVGAKGTVEFILDREPAMLSKAWLELIVDDIDEPKEATIILNGKQRIEIVGTVLGEGDGHRGALVVPVDGLIKGRNVFEFEFSDNLDGATEGYIILNAALSVLPKEVLPL